MKRFKNFRGFAFGLFAATLLLANPLAAEKEVTQSTPGNAGAKDVQQELDKQLAERRQAMMAEAHAALDETNKALLALDEKNSQDALDALARATGKLELLVARDPELALAPIDVSLVTHDLYATPEAIRTARSKAGKFLKEGKVQEARSILAGLASEIVIRVTNLPLSTYPEAIKAVSPLIDAGKIDEARSALQAALHTVVITDQVISLPVIRASAALDEAQSLTEGKTVADEKKEEVKNLLDSARRNLEMAELLGYGTKEEHKRFRQDMADLQKKIGEDAATAGNFARLRKSLSEFQTTFFQ